MINENSGASENDHFHRYNSKLLAIYDLFFGLKYPSLDWEHGLCRAWGGPIPYKNNVDSFFKVEQQVGQFVERRSKHFQL